MMVKVHRANSSLIEERQRSEMKRYLDAIDLINPERFFLWANKQDMHIREGLCKFKEKTLMDLIHEYIEYEGLMIRKKSCRCYEAKPMKYDDRCDTCGKLY